MGSEDMVDDRIMAFEDIHNFRDFGGYAGAHGHVKRGLLFRSADHFTASPADLQQLARLDLATIVDLRDPTERAQSPSLRTDPFSSTLVLVDEDGERVAPHVAAMTFGKDIPSARAAMMRIYEGLPFRDRMLPALRGMFDALEQLERPLLVHCMAGKDRTGFAVALVHHVLGVSRDDMIFDFLLTNHARERERRERALLDRVRNAMTGDVSEDALRLMMGVDTVFLDTAFDAIVERHGSVDGYLEDVLGVDAGARARLRARLIE